MERRFRRVKSILCVLLLSLLFAFSCTESRDFGFNTIIGTPEIEVLSGDDQTGRGGEALPEPVRVSVTNAMGTGLGGLSVSFEVVEGGGAVAEGSVVVTDGEGFAEAVWVIGESHNAMRVSMTDSSYRSTPCYVYATGENPTDLAVTRTLNSLNQVGDTFYKMTFYGDYGDILTSANQRFGWSFSAPENPSMPNHYSCSLFTAWDGPSRFLFGRSFDNPLSWRCLTLIGLYQPPEGYRSIAFMRMRDIGFEVGSDLSDLSEHEKQRLLEACFHVPDGINEHGLVVGLANSPEEAYTPDPGKETIWITLMVRLMLDGARTVDEAVDIARAYNIACPGRGNLGVHTMVADALGNSAILEMSGGEMQAVYGTEAWQVVTNSTVVGVSIPAQRAACNRFDYIYGRLEDSQGQMSESDSFDILSNVGWPSTEWSAVYDISGRSLAVAIDYEFSRRYRFDFEDF